MTLAASLALSLSSCPEVPSQLLNELKATTEEVIALAANASPPLGYRKLMISNAPAEPPPAVEGVIHLRLTAPGCGSDLVPGLCVADTRQTRSPLVLCNATALAQLTGDVEGGETATSAALTFVIAHELGHIAAAKAGRFTEDGVVISARASADVKRRELSGFCNKTDLPKDVEESADAWAGEILDRALGGERYGASTLGGRGARFHASGMIKGVAERTFLPPNVTGFWTWEEFSLVPASEKNVDAAVLRARCRVFRATQGSLLLPHLGSSHPTMPARLLTLARRLSKGAEGAHPPDPTSPLSAAGNINDLLAVAAAADVASSELGVEFLRKFSKKFCHSLTEPTAAQCAKVERPLVEP